MMDEIRRIAPRIGLHDLRVLMVVAEAGSMGKAARLLATSQPAVSRSIGELDWPPTSPSHHVTQTLKNLAGFAKLAIARLPTPTVALTIVPGASARPANKTTWSGVSNALSDLVHRFSSEAVISPSNVLPPAIIEEVSREP